jgi:hypothetical protein
MIIFLFVCILELCFSHFIAKGLHVGKTTSVPGQLCRYAKRYEAAQAWQQPESKAIRAGDSSHSAMA